MNIEILFQLSPSSWAVCDNYKLIYDFSVEDSEIVHLIFSFFEIDVC